MQEVAATHDAVQMKRWICHLSGTIVVVDAFSSAEQMVFDSTLTLVTFVLVIVLACFHS